MGDGILYKSPPPPPREQNEIKIFCQSHRKISLCVFSVCARWVNSYSSSVNIGTTWKNLRSFLSILDRMQWTKKTSHATVPSKLPVVGKAAVDSNDTRSSEGRSRTFSTDSGYYEGGGSSSPLSPPILSNIMEASLQSWIFRSRVSIPNLICFHRICAWTLHKFANTVSQRIFVKFEMTLVLFSGAWGKMIHEKNLKQKISWHYPFKGSG